MVLRVDQEKGYIDLSKRRVVPEEAVVKEEEFAKAKAVHGIMRHISQLHDVPVEIMCKQVSWPLYEKYGSAYEAFRKHVNNEVNLWTELDFSAKEFEDKTEKIQNDIETALKRRLIQQTLRLRGKIEVSCNEYEGIDAIRDALNEGLKVSTKDCELKINLVAHPVFVLTCVCRDKVQGVQCMDDAMKRIEESITKAKGQYALRIKPKVVGAEDKDSESGDESDKSGSDSGEEEEVEGMGELNDDELQSLMHRTQDLGLENDDAKDDDEDAKEDEHTKEGGEKAKEDKD